MIYLYFYKHLGLNYPCKCAIDNSHLSLVFYRSIQTCRLSLMGRLLPLISTQDLWSSATNNHQVVSHLSYQGLSPLIDQFGSRKSPVCSRHLRIMEGAVLLGTFNEALARSSTQSCLWALQAVPHTSWLGFDTAMHCVLWGLIYRCVCVCLS